MAGKSSLPMKGSVEVWKYLRRVEFVVFLIGLVIGFVALHTVYSPAAGRIGELEQQVSSLGEQIADLEDGLSHSETQIADLESEVQDKSTEISGLQSEIAANEAEISGLEAQIAEKDSTISSLQSQIASLEQENATKNNQITNLELEIEDLESQILRLEKRPQVLGPYFSPNGGCEDEILYWIGRANSTIHILIYSFTSDSIANALVTAHNRGIEIKVVFEEGQIGGVSQDDKLRTAGIAVRTDRNTRYMHNKVMILDGVVVITGSYDWSQTAEIFNNENLIVIKSESIGSTYEQEFSTIWGQSRS